MRSRCARDGQKDVQSTSLARLRTMSLLCLVSGSDIAGHRSTRRTQSRGKKQQPPIHPRPRRSQMKSRRRRCR
eukprot:2893488-Rhodomonas_salina.1